MAKTGTRAALEHAMEGARQAIMSREPEPAKASEPRFVWWLEFEATEEDAYSLRDYARLLDSFEGRYYKRKGEI